MNTLVSQATSQLDPLPIVTAAFERRAVPVTEIRFSERFKFKETALRGYGDSMYFIYDISASIEKHTERFFIHAILCRLEDSHHFYDTTFLGPNESAEKFYNDNYKFYVSKKELVNFVRCVPAGYVMSSSFPAQPLSDKELEQSHDRVFIHMVAWLEFFGRLKKKDLKRAKDFLAVILQREREVLSELANQKKFPSLKGKLDMFDQYFPFVVIEKNLLLNDPQKQTLREFLKTIIDLRCKLSIFYSDQTEKILHYRALLKKFDHD